MLVRFDSLTQLLLSFFFFNDTATTEIYTLSLHDALPISRRATGCRDHWVAPAWRARTRAVCPRRSEEHTSELQSRQYLVCRLLLEKKKTAGRSARCSCEVVRIFHLPAQRTNGDTAAGKLL